jgi:hypothetical protein
MRNLVSYTKEEHRLRVFDNRELGGIFGPKREEVAGVWVRLHIEELHNLYASSNIITVIKSRRMRWTGSVECMGDMRNASIFWLENLKGRDHSEDLGVDSRIILE